MWQNYGANTICRACGIFSVVITKLMSSNKKQFLFVTRSSFETNLAHSFLPHTISPLPTHTYTRVHARIFFFGKLPVPSSQRAFPSCLWSSSISFVLKRVYLYANVDSLMFSFLWRRCGHTLRYYWMLSFIETICNSFLESSFRTRSRYDRAFILLGKLISKCCNL